MSSFSQVETLAVSPGAQVALLVSMGMLLLALGFLIAYVILLRRKVPGPRAGRAQPRRVVITAPDGPLVLPKQALPTRPGPSVSVTGSTTAVAVAPAQPGPMACPSCRRQFDGAVRYCPHDARRLVPAGEIAVRATTSGMICPRCRRGFEAGVRFCPLDSEELMPLSLWEATQGKKQAALTGVIAKICPQCGLRYDLAATFCGKDGADLVTIN
ncbi:MAG: hypothetical protein HY698_07210 [Deltaproteobacteria bacterium]|nr:hypothetical protein [Deltaproteobacteria bacterium]